MEFLLLAIALIGLILAKALLAGREQDFRYKRSRQRMKNLIQEAQHSAATDDSIETGKQSLKGSGPPPLPEKDAD